MKFWKIQGAGNDFIVLDQKNECLDLKEMPALVKKACERKMSLGADGLMLVGKPTGDANLKMYFYNSDGSIGEMCGNGARCIARYAFETGLAPEEKILIETTAGIISAKRVDEKNYKIKLNNPNNTILNETASIDHEVYTYSYTELGNPGVPHLVSEDIFDSEEKAFSVAKSLRWYKKLAKGANVNLYSIVDSGKIKLKTFERGVENFTLACGTGAGSTVALLRMLGLIKQNEVEVVMPGGVLKINLEGEEVESNGQYTVKSIFLTGPTEVVAKGELFL